SHGDPLLLLQSRFIASLPVLSRPQQRRPAVEQSRSLVPTSSALGKTWTGVFAIPTAKNAKSRSHFVIALRSLLCAFCGVFRRLRTGRGFRDHVDNDEIRERAGRRIAHLSCIAGRDHV